MKAADWIAALRSGNYGQTKHRLSDGHGNFCCLGVLCEVKGLKKFVEGRDDGEVFYIFDEKVNPSDLANPVGFGMGAKVSASVIPLPHQGSILEDLNLSALVVRGDGSELSIEDELSAHLMGMNDGGYTFEEIADFIEAQL